MTLPTDTNVPRYSFTQPVCDDCWDERNPGRPSARLAEGRPEQCCHCGNGTVCGIYVRVDPSTVSYPTITKD